MDFLSLSLNEIFQLVLIITFVGGTVLILIKTIKVKDSAQKWFFVGLFGFFLGWSLLELFFFIAPSYAVDPNLYIITWKSAYIAGISALLSILIVIEKYAVTKSRFIFSILAVIGLVLVIVLPLHPTEISGARLASYIFLPAGGLSILVLYIYLIFQLSGDARRETSLIFIGFFLILGGYSLDSNLFAFISALFGFWDIMCSSLMIVGGVILALSYYRREI